MKKIINGIFVGCFILCLIIQQHIAFAEVKEISIIIDSKTYNYDKISHIATRRIRKQSFCHVQYVDTAFINV
jgi:hypothetical protein